MWRFKATDTLAQYLDANPSFAQLLAHYVGQDFDRDKWAAMTVAQALGRVSAVERERLEDVLNGGRGAPSDRSMTARQFQFVAEHSGEFRKDAVRKVLAENGAAAMSMAANGEDAAARALLESAGLSRRAAKVFLSGWQHHFLMQEPSLAPVGVFVVEALPDTTYVGRIVSVTDQVVWQEIEPGEIVEHRRENLGPLPAMMADVASLKDGHDPWRQSWCLSYLEGKVKIIPAQLLLLNGYNATPKPYAGKIIGETHKRFVQHNGNEIYSGHLKELTGQLEIGKHYELSYEVKENQMTISVEDLDPKKNVDLVKSAVLATVQEPQIVTAAPVRTESTPTVSPGETGLESQKLLSIGADIFKRHEVVVPLAELSACLGHQRTNASYSGRILEVDESLGLVVQSLGRRQATVHLLGDFKETPIVGIDTDVKYRQGTLSAVQEKGQGRFL